MLTLKKKNYKKGSIPLQSENAATGAQTINHPTNRLSDMSYPGTQKSYKDGSKLYTANRPVRLAKKAERVAGQAKKLEDRARSTREFGAEKATNYLNFVANRVGMGAASPNQKEDLVKGTKFEKPLLKLRKKIDRRADADEANAVTERSRAQQISDKQAMSLASLAGLNRQGGDGSTAGVNQNIQMPSSKRDKSGNMLQQNLPVDNNDAPSKKTITLATRDANTSKTITNSQGAMQLQNQAGNLSYTQNGQTYQFPQNVVRGRNTQAIADEGIPRIFAQNIKLKKGKIQRLTIGPDGQPVPATGANVPAGANPDGSVNTQNTDPATGSGNTGNIPDPTQVTNAGNPPQGLGDYQQLFEHAAKMGVDPALAMTMAAISAQESGPNFSSDLASKHMNYWGLQASMHPWSNRVQMKDNLAGNMREYEAYATPDEGINRWVDWITKLNPRYEKAGLTTAMREHKSPYSVAGVLGKAGYSEDKNWLPGVSKYLDLMVDKYGDQYGFERPEPAYSINSYGTYPKSGVPFYPQPNIALDPTLPFDVLPIDMMQRPVETKMFNKGSIAVLRLKKK